MLQTLQTQAGLVRHDPDGPTALAPVAVRVRLAGRWITLTHVAEPDVTAMVTWLMAHAPGRAMAVRREAGA